MPANSETKQLSGNDLYLEENKVWVFGYGSLMWKPNFKYERVIAGYICGVARRFWQGTRHHRGTEDDPGRVATLVEDVGSIVHGVGFELDKAEADQTFNYLNDREAGYALKEVTFHPMDSAEKKQKVLVYIADAKNNPDYLGPAPLQEIAATIARCSGPCGPNSEYLFNLAHMMRLLFPRVDDTHLFELEVAVKAIKNGYVKPSEKR